MNVHVLTTGSKFDYEPVIKMFSNAGYAITGPDDAELVVFCGGSDVSPHLYGEVNEGLSHCDPARDQAEKLIYEEALRQGIPMVGICRGGQFLNVMNGGKMIQDLPEFHGGLRMVECPSGDRHVLHEDHHQGMISSVMGQILARDEVDGNEEIVWYPNTWCLCFQAHPEWGDGTTRNLFFELIETYR